MFSCVDVRHPDSNGMQTSRYLTFPWCIPACTRVRKMAAPASGIASRGARGMVSYYPSPMGSADDGAVKFRTAYDRVRAYHASSLSFVISTYWQCTYRNQDFSQLLVIRVSISFLVKSVARKSVTALCARLRQAVD